MGSISLLIIGDDWLNQLKQYEDSESSQGEFRCFMGTCDTLLLKPGHTGWSIDHFGKTSVESEGYVGSARLSDIDLNAMRRITILQSEERWDIAHGISQCESWVPLSEIIKKYPKTLEYNKEIEDAAKLEWHSQSAIRKLERAGVFPPHCFSMSHSFMDLLLLSRPDYVEFFLKSTPLINAVDAICDGKYLRNVDVNAILARLDASCLLTDACVKI